MSKTYTRRSLLKCTGVGLFGALLAGGIAWLKQISTPPTQYVLRLSSAAAETEGMRSTDREFIQAVANAIMQAIAARG